MGYTRFRNQLIGYQLRSKLKYLLACVCTTLLLKNSLLSYWVLIYTSNHITVPPKFKKEFGGSTAELLKRKVAWIFTSLFNLIYKSPCWELATVLRDDIQERTTFTFSIKTPGKREVWWTWMLFTLLYFGNSSPHLCLGIHICIFCSMLSDNTTPFLCCKLDGSSKLL